MPRLFVAIDLPDAVADELADLQDHEMSAKWVKSSKIHLTLRFLGDTPEDQVDSLARALGRIEGNSFQLHPEGLGVFPSHRSPSVLWVGLRDEPALYDLQENIEQAVVEQGFDPEDRSFTPHLTIARCRYTDPERVREFMQANKEFSAPGFTADTFFLYASELDPAGARYTRLEAFPLEREEAAE